MLVDSDGVFPNGRAARKRISIDTQELIADLVDFPVAIIIDADPDLAASSSGQDFVFTGADSLEPLSHEIEYYDPTSGQLTAWVRIPELPAQDGIEIDLYYGDPAASAAEDVAGTWRVGLMGVWHLSEDAAMIALTDDSGPHSNDGDAQGDPVATLDALGQLSSSMASTTLWSSAIRPTTVSMSARTRLACLCGHA